MRRTIRNWRRCRPQKSARTKLLAFRAPIRGANLGTIMNGQTEETYAAKVEAAPGGDIEPFVSAPLADGLRRALAVAGPLLSVGILAAVFWRLRQLDFSGTWERIPTSPGFWLLFPFYYFSLSIADWVIFRRLW